MKTLTKAPDPALVPIREAINALHVLFEKMETRTNSPDFDDAELAGFEAELAAIEAKAVEAKAKAMIERDLTDAVSWYASGFAEIERILSCEELDPDAVPELRRYCLDALIDAAGDDNPQRGDALFSIAWDTMRKINAAAAKAMADDILEGGA